MRLLSWTFVAISVWALPSRARAQQPEVPPAVSSGTSQPAVTSQPTAPAGVAPLGPHVALAESSFENGRVALEAGKLVEACSLFEQSHRLDPSVGALIGLANCRERLEQLASAWATYMEAAELAARLGQTMRHDFAKQEADKLSTQLSRVIVQVGPETVNIAGVQFSLDGAPVGRALFGNAMPIDGGAHHLCVLAPDYLEWQLTFEVPVRHGNVTVAVPKLQAVPKPPPPPSPAPVAATPVTTQPAVAATPAPQPIDPAARLTPYPLRDASRSGGPSALQWTGIGIGVLGLAAAGYAGYQLSLALKDDAAADKSCFNGLCIDATGEQKSKSAVKAGNLATYVGSGSAVLLTCALAFIVFGGDDGHTRVSLGPNELFVSGRF